MKVPSRSIFSVLITLLCTSLNAQKTIPPFDVNEIIEKVSHNYISSDISALVKHNSRAGEFLLDTNVTYVPTPGDQRTPAVAFNGINYLVVWADCRTTSNPAIYCARVNQQGVVLDTPGVFISPAAYGKGNPAVASDGSDYLVVWQERGGGSRDIYGARVSQDGIVLDTNGIAISTATYSQRYPELAFDGTNYLVVWADSRSGGPAYYDIYGARMSPGGVVLDTSGIAITTATSSQIRPAIAFDGTNYLVVWTDYRSGIDYDIYGARMSPGGVVLDTSGIAIATAANSQIRPAIAFDDTNYLVVWTDNRSGIDYDIYGARVDRDGILIDTTSIVISAASDSQQLPSVAFDGINYLVVWEDYRNNPWDIYGARVNQSGIVLDPAGIVVSTANQSQMAPSIAFGGTNYLVLWQDYRTTIRYDIYGARASPGGVVLDPQGIAISAGAYHYNNQSYPSIVFDGTNYLVVWHDERNSPFSLYDIYGTRVNPNGVILDPQGIAISTAVNDQIAPTVTFDGDNYFVVWADARQQSGYDIYGARVDLNGLVLDTSGLAISTALRSQIFPSIAFDGTNFLVVWQDDRSYSTAWEIYGTRVSQSGTVLDTSGIAISPSGYTHTKIHPSVAFDGTNYLVVWEDFYFTASCSQGKCTEVRQFLVCDIYGARVSQSGTVLDSLAILVTPSTFWYQDRSPSIAFDGTNYLAVWDKTPELEYSDIYCARVNPDGVVLDPQGIAISTAAQNQAQASVIFTGTEYFVLWQDYRNNNWDIYGARIDIAGVIIDDFPVSLQAGAQILPALTQGQPGQILTAWSGWTDSINGRPVNTMRIWGKFYPFVGIKEDAELRNQPTRFNLQVFPNPIRKKCDIRYSLPQEMNVNISIFDVTGRLVKVIFNETQRTGTYEKVFHTTNLPQGVYFIKITTDNYSEIKKVIFIR